MKLSQSKHSGRCRVHSLLLDRTLVAPPSRAAGRANLAGVAGGTLMTHLAVIAGYPLAATASRIESATLAALGIRQHLTSRRRRFA